MRVTCGAGAAENLLRGVGGVEEGAAAGAGVAVPRERAQGGGAELQPDAARVACSPIRVSPNLYLTRGNCRQERVPEISIRFCRQNCAKVILTARKGLGIAVLFRPDRRPAHEISNILLLIQSWVWWHCFVNRKIYLVKWFGD